MMLRLRSHLITELEKEFYELKNNNTLWLSQDMVKRGITTQSITLGL